MVQNWLRFAKIAICQQGPFRIRHPNAFCVQQMVAAGERVKIVVATPAPQAAGVAMLTWLRRSITLSAARTAFKLVFVHAHLSLPWAKVQRQY
jgi:hypothetical protein